VGAPCHAAAEITDILEVSQVDIRDVQKTGVRVEAFRRSANIARGTTYVPKQGIRMARCATCSGLNKSA
jgi:hypothetical protein